MRNKVLIRLHGILERARKVYGLLGNAAADVERFSQQPSGDIQVFSPEEVWALVRAADSKHGAAIYLTAALPGAPVGELLALRWRDVDLAGAVVRSIGIMVVFYALGSDDAPGSVGSACALPASFSHS